MNYYVYYKVAPERAAQLRPDIERLFSLVQERFKVQGRWMRRRDDPSTYMEIYEGIADEAAFEALMEREGGKLGLQRRVERFVCA
ncbi:MAG TPA: DUF4936 family protein [Burkholderiales bacterium]|nr:DUF4936 family protein [Burkholderiales bacterium]